MNARKVDGYIRVSRVGGRSGDGYISPDVQKTQIEEYARRLDAEVIAWHTDEDFSGGTTDPSLQERQRPGRTGPSLVNQQKLILLTEGKASTMDPERKTILMQELGAAADAAETYTRRRDELIVELSKGGATRREIAEQAGLHYSRIQQMAAEAGLKKRS